jgi:Skp family chaperone for outer membrane proteins
MNPLLQPLRLLGLAGVITLGACAVSPENESRCAVIDADRVLLETTMAKNALARLKASFQASESTLVRLIAKRNEVEQRWLEARAALRPQAEVDALRAEVDKALGEEREARQPLQRDLERGRKVALDRLVTVAGDEFRRLGRAQGYQVLYQQGESVPLDVLDANARNATCRDKVDVTAQLIQAMDARPDAAQ